MRKFLWKLGCPLAVFLVCILPAFAADISIEINDKPPPLPAGQRQAGGTIGDSDFGALSPVPSRGFPNGSVITNGSSKDLEDLHLKITSPGDTWAVTSGAGSPFSTVTLSPDKTDLVLSGGKVPPGSSFWLRMPPTKEKGGTYTFEGRATPMNPPKPKAPQKSVVPEAGNAPRQPAPDAPENSQIPDSASPPRLSYSGGTFEFFPGNINFANYRDGSSALANSPSESIIGAEMKIGPMQLVGSSPDIPGLFLLSSSTFSIEKDGFTLLDAGLDNIILTRDFSVPGFDTLVQATLRLPQSENALRSQFIDELFAGYGQGGALLDFYSSILSVTNDLTFPGESSGAVITNAIVTNGGVPEPDALLLLSFGLLALGAMVRKRQGPYRAFR
jgi:hypothetical protein